LKIKLASGRFISDLDKNGYFCVIGKTLYQTFYDQGLFQPIGKQIQLGDTIFTIVGVAQDWPGSAFFNNDINNSVLIPISTAYLLSKNANISDIVMRLMAHSDIDQIQDQITSYINQNVPGQKIFFRSAKELLKSLSAQQQTFTVLLGLIGSISLIVGGIGVMNVMLVSVLERRREIGIRLAVGAKRADIQSLFLIEAVSLTVAGGILGVICGVIASYIIAKIADWGFTLFVLPPLVGFIVSVLVGIVAGVYPAYQAARLDPIQTLRAE